MSVIPFVHITKLPIFVDTPITQMYVGTTCVSVKTSISSPRGKYSLFKPIKLVLPHCKVKYPILPKILKATGEYGDKLERNVGESLELPKLAASEISFAHCQDMAFTKFFFTKVQEHFNSDNTMLCLNSINSIGQLGRVRIRQSDYICT